jgi:hypothetical protein
LGLVSEAIEFSKIADFQRSCRNILDKLLRRYIWGGKLICPKEYHQGLILQATQGTGQMEEKKVYEESFRSQIEADQKANLLNSEQDPLKASLRSAVRMERVSQFQRDNGSPILGHPKAEEQVTANPVRRRELIASQ